MSDLRFQVHAKEEKHVKYAEALEWWLNKDETLGKLLPNLMVEYARYELGLSNTGTDVLVPHRDNSRNNLQRDKVSERLVVEDILEEFIPATQPTGDIKYILNEPGTYCDKHDIMLMKQLIDFNTERLIEEFCPACEPTKLGKVMPNVAKFTRNTKVPAAPKELHPRSQAERESFKVE